MIKGTRPEIKDENTGIAVHGNLKLTLVTFDQVLKGVTGYV